MSDDRTESDPEVKLDPALFEVFARTGSVLALTDLIEDAVGCKVERVENVTPPA